MLSEYIINPILNHPNLLNTNSRVCSLLCNALAMQAFKVLNASRLPACKKSSKVSGAVELAIYQGRALQNVFNCNGLVFHLDIDELKLESTKTVAMFQH